MLAALAVIAAYLVFCYATYARHRAREVAAERAAARLLDHGSAPAVLVAYASQTGFGEQLAWRTAEALESGGLPVRVLPLGRVDAAALANTERALFIVSTTGEGDAPDSAASFAMRVMSAPAELAKMQYGLLSLGDRSYERFCAFGRALQTWLQHTHAQPLFDTVEVSDGDPGTLRHWQHHLAQISGQSKLPDWNPPAYEAWRLIERECLNPGSVGGPVYRIALQPPATKVWRAGDVAEIGPRAPESAELLPHREYSIASIPTDGRLELVVRLMRYPDGRLGLGSGWLTTHARVGGEIAVRVRENRSFHAPDDDRPMILIGNGTGIAGLRAHLKARAAAGHGRNWLVFGERQEAHDFFFRSELDDWRDRGVLARLDVAFSRDQAERVYVQDRLRAAGDEVRRWVEGGAAIYVCGSLEGMSRGVHEALVEILGSETLDELLETGRYRRDVY